MTDRDIDQIVHAAIKAERKSSNLPFTISFGGLALALIGWTFSAGGMSNQIEINSKDIIKIEQKADRVLAIEADLANMKGSIQESTDNMKRLEDIIRKEVIPRLGPEK